MNMDIDNEDQLMRSKRIRNSDSNDDLISIKKSCNNNNRDDEMKENVIQYNFHSYFITQYNNYNNNNNNNNNYDKYNNINNNYDNINNNYQYEEISRNYQYEETKSIREYKPKTILSTNYNNSIKYSSSSLSNNSQKQLLARPSYLTLQVFGKKWSSTNNKNVSEDDYDGLTNSSRYRDSRSSNNYGFKNIFTETDDIHFVLDSFTNFNKNSIWIISFLLLFSFIFFRSYSYYYYFYIIVAIIILIKNIFT